jgi:uncharacterized protein YdiU (UPF0061 family)
MLSTNPYLVLRNHTVQAVIERAQAGDYTEVNALLHALQNPFDEQPDTERFAEPPPPGSQKLVVSCSS